MSSLKRRQCVFFNRYQEGGGSKKLKSCSQIKGFQAGCNFGINFASTKNCSQTNGFQAGCNFGYLNFKIAACLKSIDLAAIFGTSTIDSKIAACLKTIDLAARFQFFVTPPPSAPDTSSLKKRPCVLFKEKTVCPL